MDLIMNPNRFDIDHIIPKSVSFDDSLNNKVLCFASENRLKGNQTPFRYFKRKQNSQWNYEQYKSEIVKLYNDGKGKLSRTKMDLLLFEEDINKYEVRRHFINRNLVDTRYASRVVLNTLQDFMSVNYPNTTVGVVRGKFTAQLRKHWNIKKDRDESHSHHAIDALTVACVPHLSLWKKQDIFKEEDIRVDDNAERLLNNPLLRNSFPAYNGFQWNVVIPIRWIVSSIVKWLMRLFIQRVKEL